MNSIRAAARRQEVGVDLRAALHAVRHARTIGGPLGREAVSHNIAKARACLAELESLPRSCLDASTA